MINLDYELETYKNIYSVTNFLNNEYIINIVDELLKIQEDWWYVIMKPINNSYDKYNVRYYKNIETNIEFCVNKSYVMNNFNNGNFSYIFKNIEPSEHYNTCYCVCCKFQQYFTSDEVKSELSKIVGEEIVLINETFFSKYENGDFLSVHHDKNKGDYAFILQLTKEWNPSHGGMLHFYDVKTNNVYKTVNPILNNLTIFKIKDVENTDHFVSMNVGKSSRFAFTGWFSAKTDL